MSDNINQSPSNVVLDFQQVMGLDAPASHAAGNLGEKGLGKKVANLIISEEVILKDCFNYQLWNQSIRKSFRYVD